MGSLLMAAGVKGKRYSLPHARIMVHQPSGGFQGQASDIEIHARQILTLRGRTARKGAGGCNRREIPEIRCSLCAL